MIQLISDNPVIVIVGVFDNPTPPAQLLGYHYVLRVGKRQFKSTWMLLPTTEDVELLNQIQAVRHAQAKLHSLNADVLSRLNYTFNSLW